MTHRLRRELGLVVRWALTRFFRWRKKSVQKKASGTATPEAARPASRRGLRPAVALRAVLVLGSLRSPAGKKASTAHFDGGARYVARSMVGQITHAIVRARSSPFSAVKMGGPFSLRCLSPLCSPAVGVGHTYLLRLERVLATWLFCHAKKGGLCFPTVDGGQAYPLRGGILSWQQRPACVLLHAGFFSEMRPVAEWRSESATKQGAAPDSRAARPVVERR